LPELLALQWDANGEPSYIRPRFDLFHLPGVGATILVVNLLLGIWLYQWEPFASRIVWAAPVLVQALLALAVVRTVGW
jgi:hypothetical protein